MKKNLLILTAIALSVNAFATGSPSGAMMGAGQAFDSAGNKFSFSANVSQKSGSTNGLIHIAQVVSSSLIYDIIANGAQVPKGSLSVSGNLATYTGPATLQKTTVTKGVMTKASYLGTLTFTCTNNKSGSSSSKNYDTVSVQFHSNALAANGTSQSNWSFAGAVTKGDLNVASSPAP